MTDMNQNGDQRVRALARIDSATTRWVRAEHAEESEGLEAARRLAEARDNGVRAGLTFDEVQHRVRAAMRHAGWR